MGFCTWNLHRQSIVFCRSTDVHPLLQVVGLTHALNVRMLTLTSTTTLSKSVVTFFEYALLKLFFNSIDYFDGKRWAGEIIPLVLPKFVNKFSSCISSKLKIRITICYLKVNYNIFYKVLFLLINWFDSFAGWIVILGLISIQLIWFFWGAFWAHNRFNFEDRWLNLHQLNSHEFLSRVSRLSFRDL